MGYTILGLQVLRYDREAGIVLMQHLESGAYQGGRATFRKTAAYIEHNLGKMGLQKLRLLN